MHNTNKNTCDCDWVGYSYVTQLDKLIAPGRRVQQQQRLPASTPRRHHIMVYPNNKVLVITSHCNRDLEKAIWRWHATRGREFTGIQEVGVGLDVGVPVDAAKIVWWPNAATGTKIGCEA